MLQVYYQATLFPDRPSGKHETGGWVGPWVNTDSLEKSTTPVSTDPLLISMVPGNSK